MTRRTGAAVLAALALAAGGCTSEPPGSADVAPAAAPSGPMGVAALAHIRPHRGIRRVAGPSRPSVVLAELLVDEGDCIERDAPIAVLDTRAENASRVTRAKAQVTNASTELSRIVALFSEGLAAVQLRDDKQLAVDIARAKLEAAEATVAADTVRAPIAGCVLAVHTRSGERVGPDGIVELGETARMYAVAEVYESDIGRVHPGQRATLHSPALDGDLTGTVERVGMLVQRMEALDADPAARTDARVVRVEIKLDDSTRAAALSNLQVDALIATEVP